MSNNQRHLPRPSWWKQWLSYLWEVPITQRSSAVNEWLWLGLRRGRYLLSSPNAIYSFEDLYNNFADTFKAIDWTARQGIDVLVLGLGLGSIPRLLEVEQGLRCNITAVELDEEVVDLAESYVLHELKNPMEILCTDATIAVEMLEDASYDLICVDIFDDNRIPEDVQSQAFALELKRLLRPEGLVLFNRLSVAEQDLDANSAYIQQVFKPCFPEAVVLELKTNQMLVSNPAWLKKPQ